MDRIQSPANPKFKMLLSLQKAKGIRKENACLVSGKSLVQEVQSLNLSCQSIHYDEILSPDILLSKELFQKLSPIKTKEPLLLCKAPQIKKYDLNPPPQGLEVLLPAGDPKNLGALVRTSLAFDASKIILLEEAAHPFLPESIKSSAAAVFKAPLFSGPSLQDLKTENLISCLDMHGKSISSLKPSKNLRLLVGEEGGNLPNELKMQCSLKIPISEKVESLNVNSALSIVLYQLSQL